MSHDQLEQRHLFFGWAGAPFVSRKAQEMLYRDPGSRTTRHQASQSALMGGSQVTVYQEQGECVLVAGHPRLARGAGVLSDSDLAKQVLRGYRERGMDVLYDLAGSFALVVTSAHGSEALLAIDRMGVQSLSYRVLNGAILFGSKADCVSNLLDERAEIELQSVFNYAYFHIVPGPLTIYRHVHRLPPGGYVMLRQGEVKHGRYWQPAYEEGDGSDIASLKTEFRSLLERSVRRLCRSDPIGTFLSGGTDSSTVAGVLSRTLEEPVRTYSIGFQAAGYDEIEYARIASRHFRTQHHEYYVTPDDVAVLAVRLAAFCDQPFGNASAVPTYCCARLAKSDGVVLLLGGDGGDELFGGNERYATQAIYSWYERVPKGLRTHLLEPILRRTPDDSSLTLLRKGRRYIEQASVPMPQRLHLYNMLNLHPLRSVFYDDFLGQINTSGPMDLLDGIYQGAHAHGMLNRMLALDLEFTLADNDLYKVNRMCEFAGVSVAYPMLDDDLVAFSLRLPERLKLRGNKLRYFFKEALRDLLPKQILTKRKHGFGLPVGIWMQSHKALRDIAYDAVRALSTRGALRDEFVDRMLLEHQSGHASYWGTEIWSLAQLELWLQAHGFAPGGALT